MNVPLQMIMPAYFSRFENVGNLCNILHVIISILLLEAILVCVVDLYKWMVTSIGKNRSAEFRGFFLMDWWVYHSDAI